MTKPLLIDLYAGEGGAAKGYQDAGFYVIGVDIAPQPRYVGDEFIQADCLGSMVREMLKGSSYSRRGRFAIHASPKCQGHTEMNNDKSRHSNQIPQTRALLQSIGVPYVIENVRAARKHLIDPVSLKGTMFGNAMTTSTGERFVLSRERLFESNIYLIAPEDPGPQGSAIANVYGGHLRARSGDYRTGNGTGRTVDFPGEDRPALAKQLFQMPWATMSGISESVPPSYARHIGKQLMEHMQWP